MTRMQVPICRRKMVISGKEVITFLQSENLVDTIKQESGMDVTFFYGSQRIMTSAVDKNGDRILGSPAGGQGC